MRNWKQLTANSPIYVKIKSSFQYKSPHCEEKGGACLPGGGEMELVNNILRARRDIFVGLFIFDQNVRKEKAVKSKIVKSLTAKREKKTMTTAPAAPHGGVATKHRRQPY